MQTELSDASRQLIRGLIVCDVMRAQERGANALPALQALEEFDAVAVTETAGYFTTR